MTVDEGHTRVRVARSGGYLLIRAADRDPETGGHEAREKLRPVSVQSA